MTQKYSCDVEKEKKETNAKYTSSRDNEVAAAWKLVKQLEKSRQKKTNKSVSTVEKLNNFFFTHAGCSIGDSYRSDALNFIQTNIPHLLYVIMQRSNN